MKNHSDKYTRHQEVARAQSHQKLQNCALLCAYVHGLPGGWYAVVDSHIDGFRSDYALIHSNVGDFECHPVRAFYLAGGEDCMEELEEIRAAVQAAHKMDELPLVATLTEEEKEAARLSVREALEEETPEDAEAWLAKLCAGPSELFGTDWAAVVEAVRK